jgi:hypothetical protein
MKRLYDAFSTFFMEVLPIRNDLAQLGWKAQPVVEKVPGTWIKLFVSIRALRGRILFSAFSATCALKMICSRHRATCLLNGKWLDCLTLFHARKTSRSAAVVDGG